MGTDVLHLTLFVRDFFLSLESGRDLEYYPLRALPIFTLDILERISLSWNAIMENVVLLRGVNSLQFLVK